MSEEAQKWKGRRKDEITGESGGDRVVDWTWRAVKKRIMRCEIRRKKKSFPKILG